MAPGPLQFGGESTLILVGTGLLVGVFAYTEHRKEVALIESGEYTTDTVQPAPWVLAVGLAPLAVGLTDIVRAVWAPSPTRVSRRPPSVWRRSCITGFGVGRPATPRRSISP